MDSKCGKYLLVFATHLIGVSLIVKFIGYIFPFLTLYYYTGLLELITCLIVGVFTFRFSKGRYLDDKVHPDKKAVLITGCDTGFGHELAKRLDSEGFRVFACCLFPSGDGATALQRNCSKKLEILELDVTKEESVKKVKDHVKQNLEQDVLWALVNNAGIVKGFSVELSPIAAFRDCLEVNTIGPVRMAKAFLPLLRKSKGRVVNVTSLGGRETMPFITPYLMSKHAAAAFNDCLRKECAVWGVRVISIEPDFFKTNLLNEGRIDEDFHSTFAALDDDVKADYGEEYLQKFMGMKGPVFCVASSDIEIVVDSIDAAVTDEYPSIIYSPRGFLLYKIIFCLYGKLCMPMKDRAFHTLMYVLGFPKPKAA